VSKGLLLQVMRDCLKYCFFWNPEPDVEDVDLESSQKFLRGNVASHAQEEQSEGVNGVRANQDEDGKTKNEQQDGMKVNDETQDQVDAIEDGSKSSAGSQNHDPLETSIDVKLNVEKSVRGSAASPTSIHSGLQQSFEENEPVVLHQIWAPSTKSLEMSDTIGNGLTQKPSSRRIGDLESTSSKLKVIKESNVKLPRVLGLDKFQHAYEKRLNLIYAEDYMNENFALASRLRDMIADIQSKSQEKADLCKRCVEPKLYNTLSDSIMALQDELADLEATFRLCGACSGHFTRDFERRGPPPVESNKTSLEIDLEKLAHFAANELHPVLRDSLGAVIMASYGASEQDHGAIKRSVLQQLDGAPIPLYSTKLQKTAAVFPTELEAEVLMKRSKARSDLVVNLKKELMANQEVQGTQDSGSLFGQPAQSPNLLELKEYQEWLQKQELLRFIDFCASFLC
jgi:hypothetical protein